MKKMYLTGLWCFIMGLSFAQTLEQQPIKKETNLKAALRDNNVYLIDSTICFQFDENFGALLPSTREVTLETNLFGNIVQKRIDNYQLSSSSWLPAALMTASYDNQENLTQTIEKEWKPGTQTFENNTKTTYVLNGAGQPTEVIQQTWTGSTWMNVQKETYQYDAGANAGATLFLFQTWENGTWQNSFRVFNSYNGQNLLASTLFQTYTNGAWLNGNRSFETYNANGLLKESKREIWNASTEEWLLSSQLLQLYENGNISQILTQLWDNFNETWLNSSLVLATYNGNDQKIEELSQIWSNGAWVNLFRTKLQYDVEGNQTRSAGDLWVNNNWRPQNACNLYWSLFSTAIFKTIENQIQCTIPNPFQTGTSLSCENFIAGKNYEFMIYDLNGVQHFSKNIDSANDIFIHHHLPNGMYIFVVKNEDGLVFRQKIAKI